MSYSKVQCSSWVESYKETFQSLTLFILRGDKCSSCSTIELIPTNNRSSPFILDTTSAPFSEGPAHWSHSKRRWPWKHASYAFDTNMEPRGKTPSMSLLKKVKNCSAVRFSRTFPFCATQVGPNSCRTFTFLPLIIVITSGSTILLVPSGHWLRSRSMPIMLPSPEGTLNK